MDLSKEKKMSKHPSNDFVEEIDRKEDEEM